MSRIKFGGRELVQEDLEYNLTILDSLSTWCRAANDLWNFSQENDLQCQQSWSQTWEQTSKWKTVLGLNVHQLNHGACHE